jgi:hypothetical protein
MKSLLDGARKFGVSPATMAHLAKLSSEKGQPKT